MVVIGGGGVGGGCGGAGGEQRQSGGGGGLPRMQVYLASYHKPRLDSQRGRTYPYPFSSPLQALFFLETDK